MMTTAVQPFTGPFSADPVHSSFAFAVRYSGLSDYRGTLSEVRATLSPGDAGLILEGEAAVDSISIKNPPQFRSHVLGPEFFDVANHPTVSFRSTSVELADDGSARVEGDLSIAGTTRPVVATGSWFEPRPGPGGEKAGLELETRFDRREFGMDWQMELPGGGIALDYEVTLTAHLPLTAVDGDQG
jgi:polyisoprenoid-binding protein YceI